MESLLEIRNLGITFEFNGQTVQAVRDSSFKINKGECLAIVGESGSGKSSIAQALIKLIDSKGNFFFKDKNISNLTEKNFRSYRKNIQIIFQDPFASLLVHVSLFRIL